MLPKKVLIAGQGIAGSVLALTMHRAGMEVTVADNGAFVSSTANAAGVINPVTGKRYVKSWMFDTFYPFAQQFYSSLGGRGRNPNLV